MPHYRHLCEDQIMHPAHVIGVGGRGCSGTRARGHTNRRDVGSDEDADDDDDDYDRLESNLFSMPSRGNLFTPGSSHQFYSSSHEIGASSSS